MPVTLPTFPTVTNLSGVPNIYQVWSYENLPGFPLGTGVNTVSGVQISGWTGIFGVSPAVLVSTGIDTTPRVHQVQVNGVTGVHHVRFDGTNDWMKWSGTLNQPYHLFVVNRIWASNQSPYYVFDGITSSAYLTQKNTPGNTGNWGFNAGLTGIDGAVTGYNAPYPQTALDVDWRIAEVFASGTNSYVKFDGQTILSGNAGTNNPSGITLAQHRNGGGGGPYTKLDVAMVIVATGQVTGQYLTDVYNYVQGKTHIWARQAPAYSGLNIICHGDSLTAGIGANVAGSGYDADNSSADYPQQMARRGYNLFHRDVNYLNAGQSSRCLGGTTPTGSEFAGPPTMIQTLVPSGYLPNNISYSGRNILCAWAGTNDLANGATYSQITGSLVYYCDLAIASGWRSNGNRFYYGTVLPRLGFAESLRIQVNDFIRTLGPTGLNKVDGIANFDTLPIGQSGAYSDTLWFIGDNIHINQQGARAMADTWYPLIFGPIADSTNPTVVSGYSNTAGTLVTLNVFEAESLPLTPTTAITGFTVLESGVPRVLNTVTINGTGILIPISGVPIQSGQAILISYSGSQIVDGVGNVLSGFNNFTGANNSTYVTPVAPGGLAGSLGLIQVNLTWNAAAGASYYNLYKSGVLETAVYGTGTGVLATRNVTHNFTVSTVNAYAVESSQSSQVSVNTSTGGGGGGSFTFC